MSLGDAVWLRGIFFSTVCLGMGVASTASAQGIFPDAKLAAVVRKYVFEKRNNQEPITEKDVENISTISGKQQGITNLAGLEKCISLASLDLEGNEVSDVTPLKDLKLLQQLNLAQNKIANLGPLADLTSLQYLQLAGNKIEDLAPLAKLDKLTSLYLSGNQVTKLESLAGLSRLWSLYLDGNPVADLKPLAQLKGISSLDLRGCGISDLSPLKDFSELKYLLLDKNKISDLGILLEMAKGDAAGPKRFAPFWNIYLNGNPLSDAAKGAQIDELKKLGARITFQP